MQPVVLKQAGGDFREVPVLQEGKVVIVEPPAVGGNIYRAALALGEDGVFAEKLFSRESLNSSKRWLLDTEFPFNHKNRFSR